MSVFSWEELWIVERMAQKRREHYLDMRNAHKIAQSEDAGGYEQVYKETFERLKEDFENRLEGQIRKRSRNVWESKGTV